MKSTPKFSLFYTGLVKNLTKYKSSLLGSVLLILIYLVFEPYSQTLISEIWVNKVLVHFTPNLFFDALFIGTCCIYIYINIQRRLTAFDFLIVFVYIKFRIVYSPWEFWPIFKYSNLKTHILYIDFIGVYYILSILLNVHRIYKYSISNVEYKFKDGFIYPDLSLEKLAPKLNKTIEELDQAGLNRNKFAKELSNVISQTIPSEAFAIGICGPWGSGKTSLINLILENLKKSGETKHFKFLDFNPWYFNSSEALLTSFFSRLENSFKHNKSLTSHLKEYSKAITKAESAMFKTGFSDLLFNENKDLKSRYNLIIEEIKKEGKILIITIDDLDRLHKKEIVEVLKLIRLIADFPYTFYIVGYDKDYINAAIQEELINHNYTKYADKIINIEFLLPAVTNETINERLGIRIDAQLRLLEDKIEPIAKEDIIRCLSYNHLSQYIKTERDLNRFCNHLFLRYLTIKEEVNFYHFFLLQLIYTTFQEVYISLYQKYNKLFEHAEPTLPIQTEIAYLDFKNILAREIPDYVNATLNDLFSKETINDRYSINSPKFFFRYFALSLLKNDFTKGEFDQIFSLPREEAKLKLIEYNNYNSPLLKERLSNNFTNPSQTNAIFDHQINLLIDLFFSIDHTQKESDAIKETDVIALIKTALTNSQQGLSLLKKVIEDNTEIYLYDLGELLRKKYIADFTSPGDKAQSEDYFLQFRLLQLRILIKQIRNSEKKFNNSIVNQIIRLNEFINHEGISSQELKEWNSENVFSEIKKYLIRNIDPLIDHLCKPNGDLMNPSSSNIQAGIKKLFVGIEQRKSFYIEQGFEKIVDLFDGFKSFKILHHHFKNKGIRSKNSEFNDDIIPESFELKSWRKIVITIDPLNTLFWRIGIRLSKTYDFPEIINKRHENEYPFIHLSKNYNPEFQIENNELNLEVYSGESHLPGYPHKMFDNYSRESLIFSISWDFNGNIIIETKIGTFTSQSTIPTHQFANYEYFQISAWAGRRNFSIGSKIKILDAIQSKML